MIGVIADVKTVSGQTIVTVNGNEIRLDPSTGGERFLSGDLKGLLLLGDEPERWVLAAPAGESGCFLLSADAAFDEPEAVILVYASWKGVGIRLRKEAGFDPGTALHTEGSVAGQYQTGYGARFCLNGFGRITGVSRQATQSSE